MVTARPIMDSLIDSTPSTVRRGTTSERSILIHRRRFAIGIRFGCPTGTRLPAGKLSFDPESTPWTLVYGPFDIGLIKFPRRCRAFRGTNSRFNSMHRCGGSPNSKWPPVPSPWSAVAALWLGQCAWPPCRADPGRSRTPPPRSRTSSFGCGPDRCHERSSEGTAGSTAKFLRCAGNRSPRESGRRFPGRQTCWPRG